MSTQIQKLCPFSKPIIGHWCQCDMARLADRCSGKMQCQASIQTLQQCQLLVDELMKQSRFVLGISPHSTEVTHTQSMKVRCGGLQGMARIMSMSQASPVDVRDIIQQAQKRFAGIEGFPYQHIMTDIQAFSHRKRKHQRQR